VAYNPPAVPSGVPHHLRVQTKDQAGNWAAWTTPPLFTFQYDGQAPIISDLTPPNSAVITTAWPVISATLSDPQPGSVACPELCRRVQPLSTTLLVDSQVVTPQVSTTTGFAYTPTQRLSESGRSGWAEGRNPTFLSNTAEVLVCMQGDVGFHRKVQPDLPGCQSLRGMGLLRFAPHTGHSARNDMGGYSGKALG
jgi:hypothetical protein